MDNFEKDFNPRGEFGKNTIVHDIAGSTNALASSLAEEGCPEGTVVVARRQSSGRGRFDRRWFSPLGGLWFSLVLRPPLKFVYPLTVIFGGCISQVIENTTGASCSFHWPNDLYIHGKKVGGILLESKFQGDSIKFLVAGVGINVNFHAPELGDNLLNEPTTLLDETGIETDISALLSSILIGLEDDYHKFIASGSTEIIEKYQDRCFTIGRRIKIIDGGEKFAVADGLLNDGGLSVRYDSGETGHIYNAERILLMR